MYNTYTIGELAKILGITPETIRYYERKGIIASIHDEKTNYRYYTVKPQTLPIIITNKTAN